MHGYLYITSCSVKLPQLATSCCWATAVCSAGWSLGEHGCTSLLLGCAGGGHWRKQTATAGPQAARHCPQTAATGLIWPASCWIRLTGRAPRRAPHLLNTLPPLSLFEGKGWLVAGFPPCCVECIVVRIALRGLSVGSEGWCISMDEGTAWSGV
jgi:hypothetical protein